MVPIAGSDDFVMDIADLVIERLMALEVHRGLVVDSRVTAVRVVPTLDVVEDLHASHGVGVQTTSVDELTFGSSPSFS